MTQSWPTTMYTDAGQIVDFVGSAIEHDGPDDALRMAPGAYFEALLEMGRLRDAIYFVSHALPRYECVVWAAQTLLEAGTIDRNEPLVVAVLRWIDDPGDGLRREIQRLIDLETLTSPVHSLAMAAFMSGGSVSLADCPPVMAPTGASAKYAAGAILDAAHFTDDRAAFLRRAAELGDAMASQAPQS